MHVDSDHKLLVVSDKAFPMARRYSQAPFCIEIEIGDTAKHNALLFSIRIHYNALSAVKQGVKTRFFLIPQ